MPMKGMEPPSPHVMGGLPKKVFEARSMDCSGQGAVGGAAQPAPPFSGSKFTCAPYGGSDSKRVLSFWSTSEASRDGGMRRESLIDVEGRRTLPPCTRSGKPAWPV